MPKHRTLSIYDALKKTNKKAAKEYLELAHYRESIDDAAAKVAAGIKEIKQDDQ